MERNIVSKVRVFTKEEKINWVFKYLVRKMDPEVIHSHKERYYDIYGPRRIPRIVTYLDCKCIVANVPEDIPFPFDDVLVKVTKKFITIMGEDFYYKFPPNFILTLWERFNTNIE